MQPLTVIWTPPIFFWLFSLVHLFKLFSICALFNDLLYLYYFSALFFLQPIFCTCCIKLWEEWTIRFGCLPPINELGWLYDSYWRTGNEIQYYSTWKKIVDKIKKRAENFATIEDYKSVVRGIKKERVYFKALLDKVSKVLRAANYRYQGHF